MHCKFAAVADYGKEVGPSIPATNGDIETGTNGIKSTEEIDIHVETEGAQPEPIAPAKNTDKIDLDIDSDDAANTAQLFAEPQPPPDSSAIPLDPRSQLPALFARPKTPPYIEKAPPPSPPPGITNTTTNFLTLDKCLPNR